jgi:serine/threonine protein phosphatase PrpC
MKIRDGVELANLSDAGCARDNNEDYFCYYEPDADAAFLRTGRLALVADGMGGARAGQVASRLAGDTIRDVYTASVAPNPLDRLIDAFSAAHQTVADQASGNPAWQGMGTTCTAVVIRDGYAYFAHVGDSRLYLIRGSTVLCLTRDHTAVNRLIEQGVITPEEAVDHPQQHVLTAALGAGPDVHADLSQAPIPLEPGDVLLLCTDGLWNLVGDQELSDITATRSLDKACQNLVETAKRRGGPDNITLQLLRYTGLDDSSLENTSPADPGS